MRRVVNVRVGERFDVYVGRGRGGVFGNPIVIGRRCCVCGETHGREGVVRCYEVWLRKRVSVDREFREKVKALKGKVLGCWCAPLACHGDVLARVCDELNRNVGGEG